MITNYLFLEYLDLEIFFNIINTKNILLLDNKKKLTDFRKTVETGADPRL